MCAHVRLQARVVNDRWQSVDGIEVRTVAQLGAVVRRLRNDRDWSQGQLAQAAGVSRVFVSQLENGKARAEVRLVLSVLQALGASVVVSHSDVDEQSDPLGDQSW